MRSVILVSLSALLLGGLFVGYWAMQSASGVARISGGPAGPLAAPNVKGPHLRVFHPGDVAWMKEYDDAGQLASEFRADEYLPQPDGTVRVTNPVARFYLANIGAQYAGHTLQIDLFDPGDGTASATSPFTMQFLAPPSGTPAIVPTLGTPVACNYNATPSASFPPPSTPDVSATCKITTLNTGSSTGIYNDKWLRVQIVIPATYACTTDCWWTVKYDFGAAGKPTDRTVWAVNVLGDPVHLTQ